MPRTPTLTFDRGTLLLHPPPRGKNWVEFATWDDRVEKFRIPAIYYRLLLEALQSEKISYQDNAKDYQQLELVSSINLSPYQHQEEALAAWQQAGKQGVVILPTASGKTYLAQLAMQTTGRSTLIVVPTLDLMHQWYANLTAAFPNIEIGLLGGGSRDRTPILVATYDSATIHAETLGNKYGLLVFDECHHLPTDFYRVIAEYAIAPFRLGLTATPDRADNRHTDLNFLIGPTVFSRTPEQLAGGALAEHKIVQIMVKLSKEEGERYQELIKIRNEFLKQSNIKLSSLEGWKNFVMMSARSPLGRRAMLAHREAKEISLCTDGKIRILADLLAKHYPHRTLIFTADNATVYRISQEFLIPSITHQTPVKERHKIIDKFHSGEYKTIIASNVLNEGIDVPDARIAIILSGTGSEREYIQRLGRVLRKGNDENKLAILYEVVTENTSEEWTSQRRRGENKSEKPEKPKKTKDKNKDKNKDIKQPEPEYQQLELLPPTLIYGVNKPATKLAAETPKKWGENNDENND
ncbi:helicase [Oscillatoriales cyanobacterium USR001]|nr:helicase [Oscillatoriales cyanobacterium USR001]